MDQQHAHIAHLIVKKLRADISLAEQDELAAWIAIDPAHGRLYEELMEQDQWVLMLADSWHTRERIRQLIGKREVPLSIRKAKVVNWRYYAVAGIIALCMGMLWPIFNQQREDTATPALIAKLEEFREPTRDAAVLQTADGKTIALAAVQGDTLSLSGESRLIRRENGALAYATTQKSSSTETRYNRLINPKGSMVTTFTLADGTKVWLNTGSSISFPDHFRRDNRTVFVQGEVYLEVAHNADWPFIVHKDDVAVKVLGTKLNIKAYDDEPAILTTLLEGSVSVNKGHEAVRLKPGEEARALSSTSSIKVSKVDVERTLAWRGDFFKLDLFSFTETVKQVERWYDIRIVIDDPELRHVKLYGELKRSTSLAGLVRLLSYAGVRSKLLQDRTLILSKD